MKRAFFTAANLVDGVNPPEPNSTVVVNDRINGWARSAGCQNRPLATPCSTSATRA